MDKQTDAMIQTLEIQRNQALTQVVQLSGLLAQAQEKIQELEKQLSKDKKKDKSSA